MLVNCGLVIGVPVGEFGSAVLTGLLLVGRPRARISTSDRWAPTIESAVSSALGTRTESSPMVRGSLAAISRTSVMSLSAPIVGLVDLEVIVDRDVVLSDLTVAGGSPPMRTIEAHIDARPNEARLPSAAA